MVKHSCTFLSCLLLLFVSPNDAFTKLTKTAMISPFTSKPNFRNKIELNTILKSSVQDNNNRNELLGITSKKLDSWKDRLPPPPEDTLVLSGDIFALLIYCFMEHITISLLSEENILHALVTASSTSIQLPVWSEVTQTNFGSSLLLQILNTQQAAHIGTFAQSSPLADTLPHYAPCLQTAGVSFTLFATCWLMSGYINQSFSLRNTITCHPSHAILITLRTWLVSAMLVFGLSVLSGKICGCPVTGGNFFLSKGDVEFILDSASVLATWRFIVSFMLNSWRL